VVQAHDAIITREQGEAYCAEEIARRAEEKVIERLLFTTLSSLSSHIIVIFIIILLLLLLLLLLIIIIRFLSITILIKIYRHVFVAKLEEDKRNIELKNIRVFNYAYCMWMIVMIISTFI